MMLIYYVKRTILTYNCRLKEQTSYVFPSILDLSAEIRPII